jgi:hypothetical protein
MSPVEQNLFEGYEVRRKASSETLLLLSTYVQFPSPTLKLVCSLQWTLEWIMVEAHVTAGPASHISFPQATVMEWALNLGKQGNCQIISFLSL